MNDSTTKYCDAGLNSSDEDMKKDVLPSLQGNTSNENDTLNLSKDIIPQNTPDCQGSAGKSSDKSEKKLEKDIEDDLKNSNVDSDKKRKNKYSTIKNLQKQTYSLSAKFYDEQLPYGVEHVKEKIRDYEKTDKTIMMICHDRDEVTDGIWDIPKTGKRHYHLIARCTDSKKRFRTAPFLESLGIVYRKDIDDVLLKQRAVETVGNWQSATMYLMHKTEQARIDNKAEYSIDEIVSNLDKDSIQQIADGYVRPDSMRISPQMWSDLYTTATELGYNLKNFEKFADGLSYAIQTHSKFKYVKHFYDKGVKKKRDENPTINRVSLFIKGSPGMGKTFGVLRALENKEVLCVSEAGKTGKLDNLQPYTDAVVMDDSLCESMLTLSDENPVETYRRNSDNPCFFGQYLIVTSNQNFTDYICSCEGYQLNSDYVYSDSNPQPLERVHINSNDCFNGKYIGMCYFDTIDDRVHAEAISQRFTICHLEKVDDIVQIVVDSYGLRGESGKQARRVVATRNLIDKINESLAEYSKMPRMTDEEAVLYIKYHVFDDLLEDVEFQHYYEFLKPYSDIMINFRHCGIMPDDCPNFMDTISSYNSGKRFIESLEHPQVIAEYWEPMSEVLKSNYNYRCDGSGKTIAIYDKYKHNLCTVCTDTDGYYLYLLACDSLKMARME